MFTQFPPAIPSFVTVPSGPFWMGAETEVDGHSRTHPPRRLDVPSFLISQTLVSRYEFDQYRDAVSDTPYALFGVDRSTGMTELLHRFSPAQVTREGARWVTDEVHSVSTRHSNLEVQAIIPSPEYLEAIDTPERSARYHAADQPVYADWWMAMGYAHWVAEEMTAAGLLDGARRWRGRLPTSVEWEKAARGPAVDLMRVMREEGVSPWNFREWARDRYEHLSVGTEILSPLNVQMRLLLGRVVEWPSEALLTGFRVHSSPSGRLSKKEIHWNDPGYKPRNVLWGSTAGYGTKQMSGNVEEWLLDSYDRIETYGLTAGGALYVQHAHMMHLNVRIPRGKGQMTPIVGFRSVLVPLTG